MTLYIKTNCKLKFSVVTNSGLLTSPLVTSIIKPPVNSNISTKNNTYLSPLGPGTLILANGNVVPVLPQTPTIIPQNRTIIANTAPIFVNPQPNNTTLIVVTSTSSSAVVSSKSSVVNSQICAPSSKPLKTLPRLKPKVCLTKTVQVNKVPIPALSSSYSRIFSNQDKFNTAPKVVKQKLAQSVKKAAKVSNEKSQENVTEANTNKENEKNDSGKRKLEVPVEELENDAKRTKVEGASSTKSAEEEKSTGEKDDPKKASKYSIDSLCKEKEVVESHNTNNIASADITNSVLPEDNNPVNKDNQKESNEENKQSNSGSEETLLKQVVDAKTSADAVADVAPSVKVAETHVEMPENILTNEQNTPGNDKLNFSAEAPNMDKPELLPESKSLEISLPHSELSNDIFASLQVPTGGQNPESTSPTAAFLLAFPLVSTLTGVKVTEVMEEDNSESRHGTPTLLQIGTMDTTKPTHSCADSLTPSLLNLDNFSFFSAKDICGSFYPGFDSFVSTAVCTVTSTSITTSKGPLDAKNSFADVSKSAKVIYETPYSKPSPYVSSATITSSYTPSVAMSKSETVEKSVSFGAPAVVTSSVSSGVSNSFSGTLPEKKNLQESLCQPPPVSVSSYNNSYNNMLYGNPSNSSGNTMSGNCYPLKSKSNVQPPKSAPKSSSVSYTMASAKPSYTIAQYNTFNPFTDITKTAVISSYANIGRTYTDPLYTNSTAYSYNCQSENTFAHNSYMHNRVTSKNDNKPYCGTNYDNNSYGENRKYENSFANNYCQMQNVQPQNKDAKFSSQSNKSKSVGAQHRPPVNWMTTPDVRQQAPNLDYLLPQFGKELDSLYPPNSFVSNTQTTYFNTNYPTAELPSNTFIETKKPLEGTFTNTFLKNDMEDNQFSWSPTKLPQLLDTQNSFVSSTLPTLVGDLALGTTTAHFTEQKVDTSKNIRAKDNRRNNKTQNYDNQANFFSVSQLVEHSKTEAVPARITGRRNSAGRSGKNSTAAQKSAAKRNHKEAKEVPNYNTNNTVKAMDAKNHMKQQNHGVQSNAYNMPSHNHEWLNDNAKVVKNPPSSYSAEALISHQPTDSLVQKQRQNNVQNYTTSSTSKTLPVPFLTENIIPYFPSVDLQQDNSFAQQNQNYHQNSTFPPHNFQSNAYSTNSLIANAPTITTNYLPSTNFMPELGTTHEYNPMISDNLNLFSHASSKSTETRPYVKNSASSVKPSQNVVNRSEERKNTSTASCSIGSGNYAKKTKKKQTNEGNNVPGFVDFSFLSMPAAINSPILPDDFHTNFLPPPTSQLYPCKNTLYPPKQNVDLNSSTLLPLPPVPVSRGNIQHPEISPSMSSVGTSLTNFNLSTIFPEINKVIVCSKLSIFGFIV